MKKNQSSEVLIKSSALLLAFVTHRFLNARLISAAMLLSVALTAPAVGNSTTQKPIAVSDRTWVSVSPSPPVDPISDSGSPPKSGDIPWWFISFPLLGGLGLWWLARSRSVSAPSHSGISADALLTPIEAKQIETRDLSLSDTSKTVIPLLEERLVVDFHKRKVGELIVRKEIETRIVEVPLRREKLVVEQVSPEYEQLAVVDLGSTYIEKGGSLDWTLATTVEAKFTSANAAIGFLESIAGYSDLELTHSIGILLVDESLQVAYQKWLEQHTNQTDSQI